MSSHPAFGNGQERTTEILWEKLFSCYFWPCCNAWNQDISWERLILKIFSLFFRQKKKEKSAYISKLLVLVMARSKSNKKKYPQGHKSNSRITGEKIIVTFKSLRGKKTKLQRQYSLDMLGRTTPPSPLRLLRDFWRLFLVWTGSVIKPQRPQWVSQDWHHVCGGLCPIWKPFLINTFRIQRSAGLDELYGFWCPCQLWINTLCVEPRSCRIISWKLL